MTPIDNNFFSFNFVNKPMLIGNSTRPIARIVALQSFGLAQTGKGRFLNICNQIEYFKNEFLIPCFKMIQFIKGSLCKLYNPHLVRYAVSSSIVKLVTSPVSYCRIEASNFLKYSSFPESVMWMMISGFFKPSSTAFSFSTNALSNSSAFTLMIVSMPLKLAKQRYKLISPQLTVNSPEVMLTGIQRISENLWQL